MRSAIIVLTLAALAAVASATLVHDAALIDEINAANAGWTAAPSDRFAGMSLEEVSHMMGAKLDNKGNLPEWVPPMGSEKMQAPDEFDARKEWSQCPFAIRDQGQCGSCWAFGAAESLSDRFCINENNNIVLSPQDLVSCDNQNYGCQGGYLDKAWQFMESTGVVADTCFPYTSGQSGSEPPCPSSGTCVGSGDATKYHAKNIHSISASQMQTALMTNGPFEVAFSVYSDFMSYSGGVYTHKSGGLLGGHAVKVLGWGTLDGTPYWLIANSWGTSWGVSGTFMIKRGVDECGIESNSYGGDAGSSSVFTQAIEV